MSMLLMTAEHALLYDRVNILNSAAFEIIARRCYGLERAFELCRVENDWQNQRSNKVRLHLLDEYDLTIIMGSGIRVPAADSRVMKEMEFRAKQAKYGSKNTAE